MILWFDAHFSPAIANWTSANIGVSCAPLDRLGLRFSTDEAIFAQAKVEKIHVIITKDADYLRLLNREGPPPAILWVTCGNTSNAALKDLFAARLAAALALLASGEPLVEIG